MLHIHAEVVSGIDRDGRWSRALTIGNFVAVVSVTASHNTVQIGERVVATITKTVRKHSVHNLEDLVKLVRHEVDETAVQIQLAYLSGNTLLFAGRGSGKIVLFRGQQTAVILDGSGAGSGQVLPGDAVVVGNSMFHRVFSPTLIRTQLQEDTEAVQKLNDTLRQDQSAHGGIAVVARVAAEAPVAAPVPRMPAVANIIGTLLRGQRLLRRGRNKWQNLGRHSVHARRKALAAVVVIIIAVITATAGFGLRLQQINKEHRAFAETLNLATHNFEEAMALFDLNPIRSRDLLTQAHELLEDYSTQHALNKSQRGQVMGLRKQIQEGLVLVSRVYEVDPKLFLRLSLIKDEAEAVELALDGTTLALLDAKNRAVYQVDIETKSSQVLFGSDSVGQASHVAVSAGVVYVLTREGVVRVPAAGADESVVAADDTWQQIAGMSVYAGNVYLLDTGVDRIWKYAFGENADEARSYLAPDTFPQFGDTDRLAIDGSVWTSGNSVQKFTYGIPETFSVSGLEQPLGERTQLYTNDTVANLYVLDSQNRRVVVFDKEGMYEAQYRWQADSTFTDFVVSEDIGILLLLSGDELYEIQLK